MNIVVGNTTKTIADNLYTTIRNDSVDTEHWYGEIYGSLPVYVCDYCISRDDEEDEDEDIYSVIFHDLVSSGEFVPLKYSYGNVKKDEHTSDILSGNESVGKSLYTNWFILVSNTDELMVSYRYGSLTVMSNLGIEKINQFIDKYLKKYDRESDTVKCYIIMRDSNLYLDDFSIKLKGDLDFGLYNEGLESVHRSMVESINNDVNGLYLLYGKPGTGKTTYIKHLIKECETEKRKFVYVPSNLFADFTTPSFIPFLMDNKGCVFIIEDCESLVTTENGYRSEVISDLLNMTDGILADAMDIKIICTFNVDDGKIDEALLRPGRCRCRYEFNLLDKDRANEAAERLGLEKVEKDVSLAEFFNAGQDFSEKKKKMGFR